MGSPKHSVDLERELTCSICTDLLYRPLTLLDCLHTFCGACVKEWFGWQATAAENAPTPPAPDSPVFTCPACRAPVRDTRRNATVSTLLDMFLAANPEKVRSDSEKAGMDAKYKPGDVVLPRLNMPDRTPEQLRLDEEERRLIAEVRAVSLQEAVVEAEHRAQHRARRRGASDAPLPSAARDSRQRPPGTTPVSRSRDPSADARGNGGRPRDPARDARDRERRRRHVAEAENRLRAEQTIMLRPEPGPSSEDSSGGSSSSSRRRHRSESRHRPAEPSEQPRRRHIEHQSSIRSLISASSPGSVDIDREIEEFARQIQEEGLLDGLDLENLDLTNNDELSRKITEAYRRRQRERSRPQQSHQRSDPSSASRQSRASESGGGGGSSASHSGSRPQSHRRDSSQPPARARRHSHSNSHARSASATNQGETGRTLTPPSNGPFLDVREEPRHRRRTASGSRSSTAPVSLGTPVTVSLQVPRVVARSQTDVSPPRSTTVDASATRPGISDVRSSSSPTIPGGAIFRPEQEHTGLSFSNRVQGTPPSMETPSFENNSSRGRRVARPADIGVAATSSPLASDSPPALSPAPQHQQELPQQSQTQPQQQPQQQHQQHQNQQRTMAREMHPEPRISCSRCKREHIEYELHYNCACCDQGNYNLCLKCYREGKGCEWWFGFGKDGRRRWERSRMEDSLLPEQHVLAAMRFLRPDSSRGSIEDPLERLQRGAFCSRCQAWAIDCYWQCGICNDGDWGFCDDCVNQGGSCTHPLRPIRYQIQGAPRPHEQQHQPGPSLAGAQAAMPTPPHSPSVASPNSMHPFSPTSPRVGGMGVTILKPEPVTFTTKCDVCRRDIAPTDSRYHCYKCASGLLPDSKPGNYDICEHCYEGFVEVGRISEENGPGGWRRCPKSGNKMVVVAFREVRPGRFYRVIECDMVGGRDFLIDPVPGAPHLQRWQWRDDSGRTVERLVTVDVRASAPGTWPVGNGTDAPAGGQPPPFPPDGGTGQTRKARWSWYPAEAWNNGGAVAKGSLLFPKGAEIHEVKEANDEWSSGTYMGYNSVFPSVFLHQADDRERQARPE